MEGLGVQATGHRSSSGEEDEEADKVGWWQE